MTEQEAIARLRDAARPAWYISRSNVRTQDLRTLLDREARLTEALETLLENEGDEVWQLFIADALEGKQ